MVQSELWNAVHSEIEWIKTAGLEFAAFIAEYYWDTRDATFLDLGCGTGASSLFLADRGFKVIAVDFSNVACKKLINSLNEKQKSLISVINSDVNTLDIEPQSIDCLLLVSILDCMEPDQATELFTKSIKWLKPNGRIFGRILYEDLPEPLRRGVKIRPYNAEELRKVFVNTKGCLMLETRYVSQKWLPVTNWTFYGMIF